MLTAFAENTLAMNAERNAYRKESLADEQKAILEEARMVLPGIQAIFGFQLIAVFNARFADMAIALQVIHLVALVAVAVSMSLVMAPAAYHRIAERGRVSARFSLLASWLIATAMAPLAVAVALESFVVTDLIVGDSIVSGTVAGALALLFSAMWFVWPAAAALRRRG